MIGPVPGWFNGPEAFISASKCSGNEEIFVEQQLCFRRRNRLVNRFCGFNSIIGQTETEEELDMEVQFLKKKSKSVSSFFNKPEAEVNSWLSRELEQTNSPMNGVS
jgi:hypothetical protein